MSHVRYQCEIDNELPPILLIVYMPLIWLFLSRQSSTSNLKLLCLVSPRQDIVRLTRDCQLRDSELLQIMQIIIKFAMTDIQTIR